MRERPPLERWFARAFGDTEGQHFGSGWTSGTASVLFGALPFLADRARALARLPLPPLRHPRKILGLVGTAWG